MRALTGHVDYFGSRNSDPIVFPGVLRPMLQQEWLGKAGMYFVTGVELDYWTDF